MSSRRIIASSLRSVASDCTLSSIAMILRIVVIFFFPLLIFHDILSYPPSLILL